jgi:hypothetical protein
MTTDWRERYEDDAQAWGLRHQLPLKQNLARYPDE